jgi:glycosyltransferase involved in cell wall biosynthesis
MSVPLPAEKNILIVHNHPIHYKTMLFGALGQQRNDFHVLYLSEFSKIRNGKAQLQNEQYPFTIAGKYGFEDIRCNLACFQVVRTILKMKPRILVSCGYHHFNFWIATITARLIGAKTVLWYESNEFDHPRVSWKEGIKKTFVKLCNYAQVYGTSNKNYLLKLGFTNDQIGIKMAVLDVDKFKTIKPDIGRRNPRTLIYVGRFSPEKNLKNLLEALRLVNQSSPESALFLRMVGYGPQEAELKEFVRDKSLESSVEFCGAKTQEQLKDIFRDGDALILPSTSEPWGLTVLEAMCAGLPVIASDHCGCAADVVLSSNGWQFEAHSLSSLMEALSNLQNCEVDTLKAMGEAGRKIAVEYSADNSARRTSMLFTNILNETQGTPCNDQDQTRYVLSR